MNAHVTPNEIARELGVTGLQFRNFLRDLKAAGDPRVASHAKHGRYVFTKAEATSLKADFSAGRRPTARLTTKNQRSPASERASASPAATVERTAASAGADEGSHRVEVEWMGARYETLADLLRPGLRAVIVGINPAPPSVAAGHYWQGRTGATLWRRLLQIEALADDGGFDYQDDAAFASGIGFTDVVKRPTPSAKDLRPGELEHGRALLEAKLADLDIPLVIFAFKAAAEALLGSFDGNGLIGRKLGVADVFVMPGPYAKREVAGATLEQLRGLLAR